MRNPKIRSLAAAGLGLLVVLLSPSPSFLQDTSGAIVREHPEIEGVYQVKLDESKIIIQQVYFKDGVLRTLTDGDGTVSVWNAVEGEPYRFTTTSERNGVFFLTFEQDDSGAYSRYHVVNEKTRLDTRAYKLRGFNDPEADPYSRSDRLGYICLLYTSPSPRDRTRSRMPSSA